MKKVLKNKKEVPETLAEKILKSSTIVSTSMRAKSITAIQNDLRAAFKDVIVTIEGHSDDNVKAQAGVVQRMYKDRTFAAFICRSISLRLIPELRVKGINEQLADRLRPVIKVAAIFDHELARSIQKIYDAGSAK